MSGKALAEVVFVVPGDPAQKTGGYRYVWKLNEALERQGVHSRIKGLAGQFPLADDRARHAMRDALQGVDSNSIVVLDGLAMGGMPEVIAEFTGRLSLISLVHHPLADESGISEALSARLFETEKRALAAVDRIFTTSEYTATRLIDFEIDPSRVSTILPGADTIARNDSTQYPVFANQPGLKLLCVANFSPRKGQDILVKALKSLENRHWQCVLAGSVDRDPRYADQVRKTIAESGLEGRFTITGEMGEDELGSAYASADLFVFPSLYEGYGMVVDEALGHGVPVLTTDGGALAERAGNGGVHLVPANSVKALAEGLQALMDDSNALGQLRQQARSYQRHQRLWRHAAEEFIEHFVQSRHSDHTLFESDWLALREPADHAARDHSLTQKLDRWLAVRHPSTTDSASSEHKVVDLGCGRGSNAVYLSRRLSLPCCWVLFDQNAGQLEMAVKRLNELGETADPVKGSVTAQNLSEKIPADVAAIAGSALIDLLSESWIERLADAAADRQAAILMTLSYNGQWSVSPADPDDAWAQATFNEHQRGEKAQGRALGPDATKYLELALQRRGYETECRQSVWNLQPEHWQLQRLLMEGWFKAINEQRPELAGKARAWFNRRSEQCRRGELIIRVEHNDLLALPADVRT